MDELSQIPHFPVAFVDGGEFCEALAGVFFEIEFTPAGLRCHRAHADSQDHLIQYSVEDRQNLFDQAATTVRLNQPPLYDADGHEIDNLLHLLAA